MPSSHLVDSFQTVMSEAFNRVAPRDNWKNAIDTRVEIANLAELSIIREAVVFMTGSVPTFKRLRPTDAGTLYRVQAAGYYATIGA